MLIAGLGTPIAEFFCSGYTLGRKKTRVFSKALCSWLDQASTSYYFTIYFGFDFASSVLHGR